MSSVLRSTYHSRSCWRGNTPLLRSFWNYAIGTVAVIAGADRRSVGSQRSSWLVDLLGVLSTSLIEPVGTPTERDRTPRRPGEARIRPAGKAEGKSGATAGATGRGSHVQNRRGY